MASTSCHTAAAAKPAVMHVTASQNIPSVISIALVLAPAWQVLFHTPVRNPGAQVAEPALLNPPLVVLLSSGFFGLGLWLHLSAPLRFR
jgi:hypothetical protein